MGLVLRNVSIEAEKGMQVGYAGVTLEGVTVVPGIEKGVGAEVTGK